MDLRDRVAVITGAGAGIGRATALRLAAAAAKVVVADYDREAGEATVRLIQAAGGEARFQHADVAQDDDVRRMLAAAEAAYGGIDILHNNAGVLSGPRFPDSGPKYWARAIGINIVGVLSGIHHAVPALQRRGGGIIVNTASISGLTPHFIDPLYAATKAAIVNLTRSLTFLKAEANIRVNCVCPGLVRTDLEAHSSAAFEPAARLEFTQRRAALHAMPALTADDIAGAVLTLIKDDAINGMAYRVVAEETWQLV